MNVETLINWYAQRAQQERFVRAAIAETVESCMLIEEAFEGVEL